MKPRSPSDKLAWVGASLLQLLQSIPVTTVASYGSLANILLKASSETPSLKTHKAKSKLLFGKPPKPNNSPLEK